MCKWKLTRKFVLTLQMVNNFSLFILMRKLMCLLCHFPLSTVITRIYFWKHSLWKMIAVVGVFYRGGQLFIFNWAWTLDLQIAWWYCKVPPNPPCSGMLNSSPLICKSNCLFYFILHLCGSLFSLSPSPQSDENITGTSLQDKYSLWDPLIFSTLKIEFFF